MNELWIPPFKATGMIRNRNETRPARSCAYSYSRSANECMTGYVSVCAAPEMNGKTDSRLRAL
jgi:hypothetical protein